MLKYLIEKEFKQIKRNSFLPRLVIMFPLVIMVLIPLVANYEVKNINLTLIDNDHSSLSRRLIHKITASGYFILTEVSASYENSLKSMEQDYSDIILVIPFDFEKKLMKERIGDVQIAANAVNGTKGGLGSAYLSAIIQNFITDLNMGLTGPEIIPRYRYNPQLSYPIYMVPALMVMLLIMICGFLPALNILSKLIPYWLIGFVVMTICFIIARIVYSLSPAGSLLTIYVYSFIFILGISGFGLVVSNYSNTLQQAMFMMFFFVITFIFLSGLYTPV
ncbi:MAG: ABC transporter permease, partial [Spirochaetaceae bacterium 4572_59]